MNRRSFVSATAATIGAFFTGLLASKGQASPAVKPEVKPSLPREIAPFAVWHSVTVVPKDATKQEADRLLAYQNRAPVLGSSEEILMITMIETAFRIAMAERPHASEAEHSARVTELMQAVKGSV